MPQEEIHQVKSDPFMFLHTKVQGDTGGREKTFVEHLCYVPPVAVAALQPS